MLRPALIATMLATSSLATAGEVFSIGADVGAGARYLDNLAFDDPSAFGLSVGLRSELNKMAHVRFDARYFDGKLFSDTEHRFVDLSAAASTPALLIFALDVHELYYRYTTRPGDDLFYVNTGLGLKGRVLGNHLKASLGFNYVSADNPTDDGRDKALGAYVGAEHLLRTKFVDTALRAAWFISFNQSDPHMGLLADGDVTVKIPAGKVALGPRLDVAYRNLGLGDKDNPLFGQRHELTASLGLALHWGTNSGGKKRK